MASGTRGTISRSAEHVTRPWEVTWRSPEQSRAIGILDAGLAVLLDIFAARRRLSLHDDNRCSTRSSFETSSKLLRNFVSDFRSPYRSLRPSHRVEPWDTLVQRRQRRKRCMRLGLIPVRDREEVIGAMVRVAVLDGGAQ
jgi:hypothetical protein